MEYKKVKDVFYFNDDCLNTLKEMVNRNKLVDLILVDPPYGINHHSNRRKDKSDLTTRAGIMNDENNHQLLSEVLDLTNQVLKVDSHIYWFTKWSSLDEHLPLLKEFFSVKNVLIWDKGNRGSGDLTGSYGNKYECIIYGMKGRRNLNTIKGVSRHDDILSFSKVSHSKLVHPHQKPLDLLEFLIQKSTNLGEVVLDMFAGVGSTLEACLNTGRAGIGIELDTHFYNIGCQRLDKYEQGGGEG